jgi:GGDEF domain-containing protein/ElaB/YqjD/DUF883 family membrane-anchored ribosome-binding protein
MLDSLVLPEETEARREAQDFPLDCYIYAIRNMAHYAADLEPDLTGRHRKYLNDLADRLERGGADVLEESRSTLRGILREYRDKSSQYLNVLRGDLNSAAVALAELLESVGDTDIDQGEQLRAALQALRHAPGESCDTMRQNVVDAADTIDSCLDAMRKRHQLAVSQFMIEIHMLHKRIDTLESAASVDMLTRLFPRQEFEARVREMEIPRRMLAIRADGLFQAAARFGSAVAEELSGAMIRRLRNALPSDALVARWNAQGFVALIEMNVYSAKQLQERLTGNLGGSYVCVRDGKAVHPPVSIEIKLLDIEAIGAEAALEGAVGFLGE